MVGVADARGHTATSTGEIAAFVVKEREIMCAGSGGPYRGEISLPLAYMSSIREVGTDDTEDIPRRRKI